MTLATDPPLSGRSIATQPQWTPFWSPDETDPTLPPVTVILDPHDNQAFTASALAAHQPRAGNIAVHPTPVATAPAYLAHDLLRAYGKHLPAPDNHHPTPQWTSHVDRSWRNTAAWTTTLGITHVIICRAHRISARHIEHLLALREHAHLNLTLLYSGSVPTPVERLLSAINHEPIDTLEAARHHMTHHRTPAPPSADYPWWTATPAFPGRSDDPWFRLPPQPHEPRPRPTQQHAQPTAQPDPPALVLPLPTNPHQDHTHPHIATVAARIHSRIAHPIHAANVALRVLTGCTPDQIGNLHANELDPYTSPPHDKRPAPHLPRWVLPLADAALALAALRGYTNVVNPLWTPSWEHSDVEQATEDCRLIPVPPTSKTPSRRRRAPSRP
ncbi:hypothetical protein [Streptomyces platensis]|uniref:hypothetical protein n=1 Tax=Streptomyces platensis TaxID=58346 RepID=UPI002E26358B|nr:hypothetical protein OG424_00305 [Streptomyces platensis]